MRSLLVLLVAVAMVGMAEGQTDTTAVVVPADTSVPSPSGVETEQSLGIKEMVFCTAVENRQPIGVDTVFSSTVKKVYCFTKVTGATDRTSVSHVWYFKDEEKARVNLPVKSKSWRTWSSKTVLKEWVGKWRVDVVSSDGSVIESKGFLITPTSD